MAAKERKEEIYRKMLELRAQGLYMDNRTQQTFLKQASSSIEEYKKVKKELEDIEKLIRQGVKGYVITLRNGETWVSIYDKCPYCQSPIPIGRDSAVDSLKCVRGHLLEGVEGIYKL